MLSRQRYVVIGAVALAVVAAMALSHALQWGWVQLGWDDVPLLGLRELTYTSLISYSAAIIAVLVVLKHQPTFTLANEVVDELAKVTWPTREETGNATVVVIVTVLISSAYLGAFDAIWLALTDWILGIEPLIEG